MTSQVRKIMNSGYVGIAVSAINLLIGCYYICALQSGRVYIEKLIREIPGRHEWMRNIVVDKGDALLAESMFYFILCIIFWHVLMLYSLPAIISKRYIVNLVKSIDYVWCFVAFVGAIYAINQFYIEKTEARLQKIDEDRAFEIDRLSNIRSPTIDHCNGDSFYFLQNHVDFKYKSAVWHAEQMCSVLREMKSKENVLYSSVPNICISSGFHLRGGSNDVAFREGDGLSKENAELLNRLSLLCYSIQRVRGIDREYPRTYQQYLDHIGLSSDDSRKWYFMLMFFASLRLVKTTHDVMN